MNEVSIFNFNDSFPVRTVTIDAETWFVGKDICQALGYTNSSKAINDHCRGVTKCYPILDSLKRKQEVRILSEADVMRLICGFNLPSAVKFERWVFEEVLPSIRKTGKYAAPVQPELPMGADSRDIASGWIERNNLRVISLAKLAENMGMRYNQLHGIVTRNPEKFADGGKLIRTGNYMFLTESGVNQLSELMPSINFKEYKSRSALPDIASAPDTVGKYFTGKGYTSAFCLTYLMFLNWYNLSEHQMLEIVNTIERMTKAKSEELPHISAIVEAELAISGIAEVADHMRTVMFGSIEKLVKQESAVQTDPVSMRLPLEMIQQIRKTTAQQPPLKGFRKTAMAYVKN